LNIIILTGNIQNVLADDFVSPRVWAREEVERLWVTAIC